MGDRTLTLSRPANGVTEPVTAKHDIPTYSVESVGRHTNRCFVLIGPPCSGKSTWCDSIVRNTRNKPKPFIICDDDIIHDEVLVTGHDYDTVLARSNPAETKRIIMERFHQAIGVTRDIIIDRTNLTADERSEFLTLLPDSYQKIGILFTLPRLVHQQRLENRLHETGRAFSRPIIDNMMRRYERPGHHEFDRTTEIDHLCRYTAW